MVPLANTSVWPVTSHVPDDEAPGTRASRPSCGPANARGAGRWASPTASLATVELEIDPQDLTKYLRIASNKGFTCFEVGEKDWIAATNAATNVVMLPSQHSSFLPRQVLHTAKNGQSFHDSIRSFFMEKEFVAKSMMVLAGCTEHYHETLLQSMNPTSWNQLDSVVAMDHVPVP